MNTFDWKKNVVPHLLAALAFLLISIAIFYPVLSGKVLYQGDIIQYRGSSQEIRDFKDKTGHESLWTNSMFGGMPTYQITADRTSNKVSYIDKALKLGFPRPLSYLFVALLCGYILFIVLRISPLLSAIGAIALAFSTYNFLILEAGHNTKYVAISYMAPVLAGVILAYRGKRMLGGLLFTLALCLNVYINHFQITYYLMMLLGIYALVELVYAIKENRIVGFAKGSAVLVLGAVIALLCNSTQLFTTYEYAKDTIRGPSELKNGQNNGDGLDKDYALAWSYGKMETFTLLIPRFVGGASGESVGKDSKLYRMLKKGRGGEVMAPTYWGAQPFTGGPIYHGAIICFLFLLGCFLVRGPLRWALIVATIFSILLAWGKNFPLLTDLFFDYFPMYNKFRVVSMILVVAQLAMPVLAILAVQQILDKSWTKEELIKKLYIATGILGGILLFWILMGGSMFDFVASGDARYNNAGFEKALVAERAGMLKADALRSLILVVLAAGILWLLIKEKVRSLYLILVLGLLIAGDLGQVNNRYMNSSNFVSKSKWEKVVPPLDADKAIMADKDPNFRVLNLAVNTFNDATTSFYHKSIGGYHGAKLRRYQDLIDRYIQNNIQEISSAFNSEATPASVNEIFAGLNVLNMLNTKYLIYNPRAIPIANNHRLGNAWFVKDIKLVPDPDSEISSIGNINPAHTAIVNQKHKDYIGNASFSRDTTGMIKLTDYKPDHLTYSSQANGEQMAVFSEIYYNSGKGWQAYLDGQPVEHIRANYILRAMKIPAGKHTIEFKFEPKRYRSVAGFTSIFSLITLLAALGLLVYILKKFMDFTKMN